MIAVSVRERAAKGSRLENVGAVAPATGNTVVSATAVPVASDATAERQAMIAEAAYYIAERRGTMAMPSQICLRIAHRRDRGATFQSLELT
jgi:hypothetical protein